MRDTEKLGAFRVISRIQAARVDLTRHALNIAEAALRDAAERTGESQRRRSAAQDGWHNTLTDARPDPGRIQRAGDLLVFHETQLKAAELDEAIARSHRESAAADLAASSALHEVGLGITSQLRRQVAKNREERRQISSEDQFRMRRYSCLPR